MLRVVGLNNPKMVSDLKLDLFMTTFQRCPNVHLKGNSAVVLMNLRRSMEDEVWAFKPAIVFLIGFVLRLYSCMYIYGHFAFFANIGHSSSNERVR